MSRSQGGSSVIDRLTSQYEGKDLTCPKCGYHDEEGEWKASTNGGRIDYQHLCPSCGNNRIRTVTLGE